MDPELEGLCDLGVQRLRNQVAETILDDDVLENQEIHMGTLPDIGGAEEPDPNAWLADMKIDGTWVDNAFIQLFSNWIRRDIMILTLYPEDGFDNGWIPISAKHNDGKIYMLYYPNKHYQSIVPKNRKNDKQDKLDKQDKQDKQDKKDKQNKQSAQIKRKNSIDSTHSSSSHYNLRRRSRDQI